MYEVISCTGDIGVKRRPPLNALRAFEAGARHLSFSQAGDELSVTQTAISHQVRQLEDWFGIRLFKREGRKISLTKVGLELQTELMPAFNQINEISARLLARTDRGTLTISVTPSFGARWLAPRLGGFWKRRPDIDLQVNHSIQLADLGRSDVDLCVRRGFGTWNGVVSERLMSADLTPVCSPDLELTSMEDLARHPLLHYANYEEWSEFFEKQGIVDVDVRRGIVLDNQQALVEAAAQGAGIILVLLPLVQEELAAGRIIAPFDRGLDPRLAFYVVCLADAMKRDDVRAFRNFLFEEVEQEKATHQVLEPGVDVQTS
jgi:LysR family glycine cleavage system transcriptional activator